MPEINPLYTLGLEPSAIETYQALISLGRSQAGTLMEKTGLSRQGIYDALVILMAKELVEYEKQGRNAWYTPVHPSKLYGLIEEQKQVSAVKYQEAEEGIRLLTASFNLTSHKPGVRYFEGIEGAREAIRDSLSATETIYTILNLESLGPELGAVNKSYVEERRKLGISKRLLILDTEQNRASIEAQGPVLTEYRFLPKHIIPFGTAMEIYNNKISYITLRKENLISIILEDPDIYTMHRSMFELLWETSQEKTPEPTKTIPPKEVQDGVVAFSE